MGECECGHAEAAERLDRLVSAQQYRISHAAMICWAAIANPHREEGTVALVDANKIYDILRPEEAGQ